MKNKRFTLLGKVPMVYEAYIRKKKPCPTSINKITLKEFLYLFVFFHSFEIKKLFVAYFKLNSIET